VFIVYSETTKTIPKRINKYTNKNDVIPAEKIWGEQIGKGEDRWKVSESRDEI